MKVRTWLQIWNFTTIIYGYACNHASLYKVADCLHALHAICSPCMFAVWYFKLSSSVVYSEKFFAMQFFLHVQVQVVYLIRENNRKLLWSVITLNNAFDVHDEACMWKHYYLCFSVHALVCVILSFSIFPKVAIYQALKKYGRFFKKKISLINFWIKSEALNLLESPCIWHLDHQSYNFSELNLT